MKNKLFPVLFAGVLLGTIFANCTGVLLIQKTGIFDNDFWMRIRNVSPQIDEMLWYVTGTRLRESAVWLLLMMTPFGGVSLFCLIFGFGFWNGLLSSISFIQQGYKGLLLFWLIMVSSWLLFYPGLIRLCTYVRRGYREKWFSMILAGVLFVLICSCVETYFFVFVIKKICM